jgi:hypothetical protein
MEVAISGSGLLLKSALPAATSGGGEFCNGMRMQGLLQAVAAVVATA